MKTTVASILDEERARVATILESKEGLARPKLARELALRSPMGAEAALALLGKAPAEDSYFMAAMAAEAVNIGTAVSTSGPFASGTAKREKRLEELKTATRAVNLRHGARAAEPKL